MEQKKSFSEVVAEKLIEQLKTEAAEAAVRALDALPDTETRTAMVELARLSVSRDA